VFWRIVSPVVLRGEVMATPQPMSPVSPHTLEMVTPKAPIDPLARDALVGEIVRVKSFCLHAAWAARG
jgi:hypothetical protein